MEAILPLALAGFIGLHKHYAKFYSTSTLAVFHHKLGLAIFIII